MKLVFMGTPDFAVDALKALYDAGHEIVLVVTQPDRPKGRSMTPVPCPVKEMAQSLNLPVFQPEKIKREEAVEELKKYPADAFVVAAFGQILSQEILDMPRLGCFNIHASLLPKLRGAAPIQWSVLNGDETTGVTIMEMNAGLDTGDILIQKEIPITEEDTGDSMFEKLKVLGASLIVEALPLIEAGELKGIPQDSTKSTYAGMLNKSMGRISFKESAEHIARLVRGLYSWPCAYAYSEGKCYKFLMAHAAKGEELTEVLDYMNGASAVPGEVVFCSKDTIYIMTGDGILALTRLQPEGKKQMSAHDFLLGYHVTGFEE